MVRLMLTYTTLQVWWNPSQDFLWICKCKLLKKKQKKPQQIRCLGWGCMHVFRSAISCFSFKLCSSWLDKLENYILGAPKHNKCLKCFVCSLVSPEIVHRDWFHQFKLTSSSDDMIFEHYLNFHQKKIIFTWRKHDKQLEFCRIKVW